MLKINELARLYLGIQGENGARSITVDVSAWINLYPNGSVTVWHTRCGDSTPSPTGAVYDSEEQTVTWDITSVDTFVAGIGEAEFRLIENEVIKKNTKVMTGVSPSVTQSGTTLGSDWQSYINAVDSLRAGAVVAQEAAEDAQEAAEDAKEAAEDAQEAAEDAQTAAETAQGKAEDAQTAAEAAAARAEHASKVMVPAGGTEGQRLAKKSGTDFDMEWKTDPYYTKPAGGIPASDMAEGAIPDPTSIIDDTAGDGDTNKVWSADKSADLMSAFNDSQKAIIANGFCGSIKLTENTGGDTTIYAIVGETLKIYNPNEFTLQVYITGYGAEYTLSVDAGKSGNFTPLRSGYIRLRNANLVVGDTISYQILGRIDTQSQQITELGNKQAIDREQLFRIGWSGKATAIEAKYVDTDAYLESGKTYYIINKNEYELTAYIASHSSDGSVTVPPTIPTAFTPSVSGILTLRNNSSIGVGTIVEYSIRGEIDKYWTVIPESVNKFSGHFNAGYISSNGTITNAYNAGSTQYYILQYLKAGTYLYRTNYNLYGVSARRAYKYSDGSFVSSIVCTQVTDLGSGREIDTFTLDVDSMVGLNTGYIGDTDKFMIIPGSTASAWPENYVPYKPQTVKIASGYGVGDTMQPTINPLYGKKIAVEGDSITAGNNITLGYSRWLKYEDGMTVFNTAVGGSPLAEVSGKSHIISESIADMEPGCDYYIFEGGYNDRTADVATGTLTAGYPVKNANDDDISPTTVAGAMEYACRDLVTIFGGAKVGFIFCHNRYALDNKYNTEYRPVMKAACEKWGVPYLDLQDMVPPFGMIQSLANKYTQSQDGTHPNWEGYEEYYVPKIRAWLKTL